MKNGLLTYDGLDLKKRTVATIIGVAMAVALPQLVHVIGIATGLGTLPGETYLPMHLPVILTGFIAGPAVGAVTGAASPLISSALTGMPAAQMLPFMVIELMIYGLTAGFLSKEEDGPAAVAIKVFIAQIAGRAVKALAILFSFYALGSTAVPPQAIWGSIVAGIPGIIIQLVSIPCLMTLLRAGAGRDK